jgi:NTP pyrophosphatase (non-canonical NTP hydrolase)
VEFKEYQKKARETAVYDTGDVVGYLFTGLVSEVGEVAALYERRMRDKEPLDDYKLKHELGDILWYVTILAEDEGIDLEDIAKSNIEKLHDRFKRNVIHGKGDNR